MAKFILMLAILAGFGWLAWRLLIFLRSFLKPLKEAVAPFSATVDPYAKRFNEHVEASLNKAGLGVVSDVNKKVANIIDTTLTKVDHALDASEQAIEQKRK